MSASTVIGLGPNADGLVVEIDDALPMAPTAEMEARWVALCAANPRLFNGRILAFQSADAGRITARVETYKRMATQEPGEHAMVQLGVTGVLTAPGAGGTRSVLLGRRARDTHVYPGRWELAPSGGIDAPEPGTRRLALADIRRQLELELVEETGVDPAGLAMTPVALCHDPDIPSVDVVFRIDLDEQPGQHAPTWEFDELVWFDVGRLAEEFSARGVEPTPPSAEVLRWMGWM